MPLGKILLSPTSCCPVKPDLIVGTRSWVLAKEEKRRAERLIRHITWMEVWA